MIACMISIFVFHLLSFVYVYQVINGMYRLLTQYFYLFLDIYLGNVYLYVLNLNLFNKVKFYIN